MRILPAFLITSFILFSCADRRKIDASELAHQQKDTIVIPPEVPVFFQVTNFLKGQIYELQNGGLTPIKYVINNGKRDSSFLKIPSLEKEFADFLTPVIDSSNLADFFTEKKFFDQTLHAITLTYDPVSKLPDTIALRHWDVYIDPDNGVVKRIYMVKELEGKRTQQLTWSAGKSARNVIINESSGKPSIEREIEIKWDY